MKKLISALLSLALIACGEDEERINNDLLIPVEIFGFYDYGEGGVGVFLKGEEAKVVPIIIGHFEAQALQMAINKQELPRPIPYDLLQAMLERMEGNIRQLVIHSIKENVFHAYLVIEAQGKSFSLDCRPSDGMVMVSRLGAPIYLTSEVMEQAGTSLKDMEKVMWNPSREQAPASRL